MKKGDIIYSEWGWEQTNVDFYEVVVATEKTITIIQLKDKKDYTSCMEGTSMPVLGEYEGCQMRRKIIKRHDDEWVRITDYAYGRVWDGQPRRFSQYA